ncbi:MAG: thioredoxin family protein [Acidiferrobacterales bacterium]
MALSIEVFASPGCAKCGRAKDELRKLSREIGEDAIRWREVNILDEIDYAVSLGVMSAPAIAIDGELVFTGLPSQRKLRAELESRLKESYKRDRP